ncbi:hypothetical protein CMK11_15020 [Candidatus Poribacteria bacterium]|nr:hypothetical protein [Candidatus Poribacteria bacterium]
MRMWMTALACAIACAMSAPAGAVDRSYAIVGTGQTTFYDAQGEIAATSEGDDFYGQDAQTVGAEPSYTDNSDGSVTDNVTGLMWQRSFEVMGYDAAVEHAAGSTLAGHSDWRLPSIKEMYSLIVFSGADPSSPDMFNVSEGSEPFIDTDVFDFEYGANGERIIDSQYVTSTVYTGLTMGHDETVFGVNMADGRIKGYPMADPRTREPKAFSVKLVRGNELYGHNDFMDNDDGTVSDAATGMMWTKRDGERDMDWQEALSWAQQMNDEQYLGYSDWRLPDAKELHSIVDYSRSPQATGAAAIDPVFDISTIEDEGGIENYPSFWTGTTHVRSDGDAGSAVYICFGEALGFMTFPGSADATLLDVHGAGAQRADPKTGDPADYPSGRGPQGDVVRIYHYVRLVRDMDASPQVGSAWDVNRDGVVDIVDLVVVASAFGASGVDLAGDANGDGSVTIVDLVMVASHFGEARGVIAAAPQLPGTGDSGLIRQWVIQARRADDGSDAYRAGVAVLERLLSGVPDGATGLLPNYPNPFNPETWIPFELNEAAEVTFTIYDVLGRVVRRIELGYRAPGVYHATSSAAHWDGRNDHSEEVASGTYFVGLRAGDVRETRRIVVMK